MWVSGALRYLYIHASADVCRGKSKRGCLCYRVSGLRHAANLMVRGRGAFTIIACTVVLSMPRVRIPPT